MTKWPEIITVWALEDDGCRRDRILATHSLLMKVIARKALEDFRCSLDNPRADWRFHPFDKLRTSLSRGLGYDLDRLESEFDTILDNHDSPDPGKENNARIVAIQRIRDQTLEALGDARRIARKRTDAKAQKRVAQRLVRVTERFYDQIEETLGSEARREFIADGLTKTKAWLARHKDPDGKVAAQMRRLSEARRRLKNR